MREKSNTSNITVVPNAFITIHSLSRQGELIYSGWLFFFFCLGSFLKSFFLLPLVYYTKIVSNFVECLEGFHYSHYTLPSFCVYKWFWCFNGHTQFLLQLHTGLETFLQSAPLRVPEFQKLTLNIMEVFLWTKWLSLPFLFLKASQKGEGNMKRCSRTWMIGVKFYRQLIQVQEKKTGLFAAGVN